MKSYYVIHEIDGLGYWSSAYRRFRGFLFTDKFDSEEELLEFAQKEGIGVFKITKVYDSKL